MQLPLLKLLEVSNLTNDLEFQLTMALAKCLRRYLTTEGSYMNISTRTDDMTVLDLSRQQQD